MTDPTLRAVGDLIAAEFRVATIQAVTEDPAASRDVGADPLVAVLRQHLSHLPESTQQSARTKSAALTEAGSERRSVFGPLEGVDLRIGLAEQVAKVRATTNTIIRLDDPDTVMSLHRRLRLPETALAPAADAPERPEVVTHHARGFTLPPGMPIVLGHPMQVGVFLDRLHCFDKTGVGIDHDRIGLVATGIDPERLALDDISHSIDDATFGRSYDMGYFSKGDDWPRPFPQPGGQYLHYTEHHGGSWPRTYTTTLTLVQCNPFASTSLHDDLLKIDNALRGKLIDYLAGLTAAGLAALGAKLGLGIGELGGPVGAVIGAVVGALVAYAVGELIGWIEDYFQDWYFQPFTLLLHQAHLDDQPHDWNQHHSDVYTHSGHYSIDAHHYRRPFDAHGNAIW